MVVGFFGLIVLVAILGVATDDANSTDEPSLVTTNTTSNESSNSVDISGKVFQVGESVESNGRILTVTKVDRNYDTGNQFSQPKTGREFVKATIEIENNSNSEISYSPFEFKVQDSNGNQKDLDAGTYSLDLPFESGSLAGGGKVSGDMLFEVPKDDQNLTLIYTSSFWGNQKINIQL